MTELKTQPNDRDVVEFLYTLDDERRRQDCFTVLALMRDVTGHEGQLWGDNIVGFGRYRYTYASGRTGEWFLTGFSPRKQNLTLYIMAGFDQYNELMQKLGKHTTGKSCLYIKRLADVDLAVLRELVRLSAQHIAATNG